MRFLIFRILIKKINYLFLIQFFTKKNKIRDTAAIYQEKNNRSFFFILKLFSLVILNYEN